MSAVGGDVRRAELIVDLGIGVRAVEGDGASAEGCLYDGGRLSGSEGPLVGKVKVNGVQTQFARRLERQREDPFRAETLQSDFSVSDLSFAIEYPWR